jgi:hypothetical protein
MADTNTPTLVVPETSERSDRPWNMNVQTRLASLALALAVASSAASAQEPPKWTQVAIATTPTTPAAVPSAKGGWQVVKIDGVEYTFAAIAGMKEEEQIKLIEKALPKDQERVANYIVSLAQAAIDANKGKLAIQQAAIAKNDNDVLGIITAIDKMIVLWKKLWEDEKKALNAVIAYGKPPEMVTKAKTILATI